MKVVLENSKCRIIDANEEERNWLQGYLLYNDPSQYWAQRQYGIKEPKKTSLLDRRGWTFPAGLLPKVKKAAFREYKEALEDGEDEYASQIKPVEVIDGRVKPTDWDYDAVANGALEWLRDYQFECVWLAYERERGIIKAPTGSGKSEILWGIMTALPCHFGVFVREKQLMRELAARWEKRSGLTPGIVGDGEFRPDPNGRATFGTFGTLSRGLGKNGKPEVLKFLRSLDGLIVDECHGLPAKTCRKVGLACENAYYRIGTSATPMDRDDSKTIFSVAVLGDMFVEIGTQGLIEMGFISRPTIRMIPFQQSRFGGNDKGGWMKSYEELISNSRSRNALVCDIAQHAAKPSLVFVKNISHGRVLNHALNESGVSSDFVWGDHAVQVRESKIQRLRRGDVDVLVTSSVMQQGVDVPELASVINAAGMRTTIGALQRLGRGMRRATGKDSFEMWDVFDTGDRFLERHSKQRRKAYEKEGHEVHLEWPKEIRKR